MAVFGPTSYSNYGTKLTFSRSRTTPDASIALYEAFVPSYSLHFQPLKACKMTERYRMLFVSRNPSALTILTSIRLNGQQVLVSQSTEMSLKMMSSLKTTFTLRRHPLDSYNIFQLVESCY